MKKIKSSIIFEKTLQSPKYSHNFTLRVVKQEYEDCDSFILEKLMKYDAMGSPVWLEIETTELYLAIETMGEFFESLKEVNFKSLNSTIEENKRLKDMLEVVLAFHHKQGTHIDFDVTGQGERFIKRISKELYNDCYPEDETLDQLVIKHEKSI